jgi:hypothetical protein
MQWQHEQLHLGKIFGDGHADAQVARECSEQEVLHKGFKQTMFLHQHVNEVQERS